jgi:hypothetical protein
MSLPNEESQGEAQTRDTFRLDLTQDEFDREFFGQVLQHGHSNPDILRRQAELLSRSGDYVGALELDRLLAKRCPTEPVVFYNLAWSLSMSGQQLASVAALAKAIDLGYHDFAHIESDPDLDSIRELESYAALMRIAQSEKKDPYPRLA